MRIDSVVASLKELAKDSKNIEEIYENLELISEVFEDNLKLEIKELKKEYSDKFDSMISLLRIIKEVYETNNFSESIINEINTIAFKHDSPCMLWEHNKK